MMRRRRRRRRKIRAYSFGIVLFIEANQWILKCIHLPVHEIVRSVIAMLHVINSAHFISGQSTKIKGL